MSCKFRLLYHIILVTKYRKKSLTIKGELNFSSIYYKRRGFRNLFILMNHYSVKGIIANSINDILHMINDNYGEEFLSDFISKFCGKLYEL